MSRTETENKKYPPADIGKTPDAGKAAAPAPAPSRPPLQDNAGKPEATRRRYDGTLTAPLLVFAVFLLLLAVRLSGPRIFNRDNEYLLLTVVQVLIFMIPAAAYMKLCHVSAKRLRIYPFGLNHLLLIVSAIVAAASGSLLLSFAASGYESLSGTFTLYGAFASPSGGSAGETVYLIVAYAALPAFCEEILFRALLCSEYEASAGSFSAVVLTSLWFAMLHFDLRSFGVYLFSGILLSLTLYASRSFFAAFAVHFGYNLVSVFGMPFLRTVYDAGGKTLYFLIIGFLLLISMFVFCGECARLYGSYADGNLSSDYRVEGSGEHGVAVALRRTFAGNIRAFLAPSALLCYLLYIAVMLFLK